MRARERKPKGEGGDVRASPISHESPPSSFGCLARTCEQLTDKNKVTKIQRQKPPSNCSAANLDKSRKAPPPPP